MGVAFAPTWLRQVSPPPLLHRTTLTTAINYIAIVIPLFRKTCDESVHDEELIYYGPLL